MPELVGDVVGMLDALGVRRAHLVGHDWGAAVAWQVAARHPARVRTLTAVSVPHPLAFTEALASDADQRPLAVHAAFQARAPRKRCSPTTPPGAGRSSAAPRRAWTSSATSRTCASRAADGLPQLVPRGGAGGRRGFPAVTVPTLYVWWDGDLALGDRGRGDRPHVAGPYRFVELPGVSHWVPEEVPDQLAALLLEHLQG